MDMRTTGGPCLQGDHSSHPVPTWADTPFLRQRVLLHARPHLRNAGINEKPQNALPGKEVTLIDPSWFKHSGIHFTNMSTCCMAGAVPDMEDRMKQSGPMALTSQLVLLVLLAFLCV